MKAINKSDLAGTIFPIRSLNTMSDAIAIASPNGRMSKRAKKSATEALCKSLFGVSESELTIEILKGTVELSESEKRAREKERLLRAAKELRVLSERGMCRRKFSKEADRLEALAATLA